jgi:hypothetical protein
MRFSLFGFTGVAVEASPPAAKAVSLWIGFWRG